MRETGCENVEKLYQLYPLKKLNFSTGCGHYTVIKAFSRTTPLFSPVLMSVEAGDESRCFAAQRVSLKPFFGVPSLTSAWGLVLSRPRACHRPIQLTVTYCCFFYFGNQSHWRGAGSLMHWEDEKCYFPAEKSLIKGCNGGNLRRQTVHGCSRGCTNTDRWICVGSPKETGESASVGSQRLKGEMPHPGQI